MLNFFIWCRSDKIHGIKVVTLPLSFKITYEWMFYDKNYQSYEGLNYYTTLKITVFLIIFKSHNIGSIKNYKRETSLNRCLLTSSYYIPHFTKIGEIDVQVFAKFYEEWLNCVAKYTLYNYLAYITSILMTLMNTINKR